MKGRKLNIVGIDGMPKTEEEEIRNCLEERRAKLENLIIQTVAASLNSSPLMQHH